MTTPHPTARPRLPPPLDIRAMQLTCCQRERLTLSADRFCTRHNIKLGQGEAASEVLAWRTSLDPIYHMDIREARRLRELWRRCIKRATREKRA